MDGSPLRALRKRLKVSQKDFAARVGLDARTVSNVEDGRVTIGRETYDEWKLVIETLGKEKDERVFAQ